MATILALDIGLSSLKTIVAVSDGSCKFCESRPYPTYSPRAGWVEQDPGDWISALKESVSAIPTDLKKSIDAISFSGHMSSVLIINEEGAPITKCLTLTDTRGYENLGDFGKLEKRSIEITGNGLGATHWVLKVHWLLKNIANSKAAYKVLFAKDYLRSYICGHAATEYTDCGNTGLMDYSSLDWDEQAIIFSGLPRKLLPDIHKPYDKAGLILPDKAKELGLRQDTLVFFGGADMACGALGSGINDEGGDVAITLGSCATMLTTINSKIDKKLGIGKISFHPYIFPGSLYGLGSHFTGGLGANWFSGLFRGDMLKPNYDELQKLAFEVEQVPPGCEGLIMLPFLVGSGSPHNKGTDRGAFIGMTLSTTRGALFRSVLEGIAFNLLETEYVFEEMANKELKLFIGGGGIKIKPWPEIIADVFGRNITFLNDIDVSTWGAIRIGAFGLGAIDNIYPKLRKDENQIIKFNKKNHETYREKFKNFRSCYKDISDWLERQS